MIVALLGATGSALAAAAHAGDSRPLPLPLRNDARGCTFFTCSRKLQQFTPQDSYVRGV
jgi:hypothetical protein